MRSRLPLLCLALLLGATGERAALACDFCMPVQGVNPLAWMDYASLYSHELYLGSYRSGWSGAGSPPDDERDEHLTNELTVSRRLTDRFALAVTVLAPYSAMRVDGGATRVAAFGLGDTYLFPSYLVYQGYERALLIGPVVKVPTGQTSVVDNHGATADPDFQLGSGSWDFGAQLMGQMPLGGGQVSETFMAKYDGTGRFLAAGPMATALDHSYGWEGMQDLVYSHPLAGDQGGEALLLGELGLDVGALGHESYGGVANPNAGGAIYLLVAPGLELVLPGQKLVLEAVVQVPAVQYWSGTQLGYTIEGYVGVRYLTD